jgi:hypothetical protein
MITGYLLVGHDLALAAMLAHALGLRVVGCPPGLLLRGHPGLAAWVHLQAASPAIA